MDGITPLAATPASAGHSHVFLGGGHEQAERRTWWVIALCGAMMLLEIAGGLLFGSIALVEPRRVYRRRFGLSATRP